MFQNRLFRVGSLFLVAKKYKKYEMEKNNFSSIINKIKPIIIKLD